jgi:hypothetical protein
MIKNPEDQEKDTSPLIEISYDHFINEKVGFGKYQILTVLLVRKLY